MDERFVKQRRYKFIIDPDDSWLGVPHQELISLDIVELISSSSYVGIERVYLDSCVDMPKFTAAATAARWEVLIHKTYTDERSWVRTMAPYDPHYITNPVRLGGRCIYLPTGKELEVVGMSNNRIYVGQGKEAFHRIKRHNPYVSIRPL